MSALRAPAEVFFEHLALRTSNLVHLDIQPDDAPDATQIVTALAGATNHDTIVSRNSDDASAYLGDGVLTSENIDHYASELVIIDAALSKDYLTKSATFAVSGSAGVNISCDCDSFPRAGLPSHGAAELALGLYNASTGQSVQTGAPSKSNVLVEQSSEDWSTTLFDQNLPSGYNVSIQRVGGGVIESHLPTFILIHGWNSDPDQAFGTLIPQIQAQSDFQVLNLDWSGGAATGLNPYPAEQRIQPIAAWAAETLSNHGLIGENLNLIGHSFGSYISDEIAQRVSRGVNTIIAFDPATNIPFGYDPTIEVNFSDHSAWSWAFHDGEFPNYGDEITPLSADEAFVVTDSDHSSVKDLFSEMLDHPNNGVSQFFQLSDLLDKEQGPWEFDEYESSGGETNGGYEALIDATSAGTVADSIRFITHSTTVQRIIGTNASQSLVGGSGRDSIDGLGGIDRLDGGSDVDTMTGGNGSDYYYVRNAGDSVIETNSSAITGGTDLVYSYLGSYVLGANVENGRIMSTGAANLTGNTLGNLLYAGIGNNMINGDAGTDTLSYVAGATSGVTVSLVTGAAQPTVGSGSDTISNIERLTGSNYPDSLSGNSASNVLRGMGGNDKLTGRGGNDRLIGEAGLDKFDFNAALSAATNVDRITDYTVGEDLIRLDDDVFTAGGVANAVLTVGAFHKGAGATTAHDSDDRIIYNTTSGDIYYDEDGNGTLAPAVLFATLTTHPDEITASSFFIIA